VTDASPDATPWLRYVRSELSFHVRHHFAAEALALLEQTRLAAGPRSLVGRREGADVLVPVDVTPEAIPSPWQVPFRDTRLTLWGRVPAPEGWTSWPSAEAPLWHLRPDGAAMPAWDLFGNLRRLLALEEERGIATRDRHGRVAGAMSPREPAGLLEVPALNEAAAALVALRQAQAEARANGGRTLAPALLGGHALPLLPAGMILSHDLDILRGNDPITQSIRLYRWLAPLVRGRLPGTRGLRALVANARAPHALYRDAIARFVEIERAAGARSSFYFLNGTGGRFGARSGDRDIPASRRLIPNGWNVGMHYNYDTLLDPARFRAQRESLERLLGHATPGGRAHYLRFDPERSFAFYEAQGLRYDETLAYPDRAGFRAGVAGAYHPADPLSWQPLQLVEIPLALMDVALHRQYPDDVHGTVRCMFRHLREVGGTLSMVVHLEAVGRPELGEDAFRYAELLDLLRGDGARFLLPGDLT
jgi:hypothetical protein